MYKLRKILVTIMLVILIITYIQNIVFAAESELTLTPKPETNNIHLKWTGPQNSSYKVYQKSQGVIILKRLDLQILVIMQQMKRLRYLIYIRQGNL